MHADAAALGKEAAIPWIGLILPTGFHVMSFAPLAVFETANAVAGEGFHESCLISEEGGRMCGPSGKASPNIGKPLKDVLEVASG